MADDTQKSIFSAFGETQPTSTATQTSVPETQTPSVPSNQGTGGSIFTAFSGESNTQSPPAERQSPSETLEESKPNTIFDAFSNQEAVHHLDRQHVVESSAEPADPNAPWYKKAWDWANNPVIDEQHIERWLGREDAGGIEKGIYDLIAGLTSPLQIALTVGTFGSGALLEAGGATALRAAGLGAKEIEEVTKGSQLIAKAIKAGKSADEAYAAMPALGLNPNTVLNGLEAVSKAGMTPEALISTGLVRRAGGAMLRSAGVTAGDADKIANWAQFAVDAGFTAQNAYGAAVASPRVLDAIKEGDYETAKRLAIDALGSGVFAAIGGRSAFHHSGELMSDAAASAGLKVRPTEENLKLIKEFEPYQRDINVASEEAKNFETDMRKRYKDLSSEDMLLARMRREAGSDENLAKWHDMIAEAAGREPEPVDLSKMEPTERHDYINRNLGSMAAEGNNFREAKTNAENMFPNRTVKVTPYLDKNGDTKYAMKLGPADLYHGTTIENAREIAEKGLTPKAQNEMDAPKVFLSTKPDYALKYPSTPGERAIVVLRGDIEGLDTSHSHITQEAESTKPIPKEKIKQIREYDAEGRLKNIIKMGGEDNPQLRELIDAQHLKDKPKEYVDKLLASTDVDKLTDRHREFAKEVGEHFDKTLEKAVSTGALSEGADNYVTRIWKNPDNDTVRKFRTVAQGSGFSVNTSMARHRIYGSTIEGLLRGEELADHDSIALAAHNGNEFGRIVAARQTIERLRAKGTRASDGRPMVALSGTGHVVEGEEGENPAVVINPKGMQSIRMADKVVSGLQKNVVKEAIGKEGEPGYKPPVTELDKLLKEGKIVKYGTDKQTGKDLYAWTTHDYRTVDNPAFRGWKVPSHDTEGNPIMVNGELRAHPEAHEYLNRRLGTEESIIKKIPGAKTVLAAGREAKGLLLFVSPFHAVQEGLRAIMTGISPLGREKFNPANPMHLLAAEKGVWEGKDYKGVSAFEDGMMGHSKLLAKTPGLRWLQSKLQTFLFDRYIPNLKLRSFRSLYERYEKAYPEWTKDKVADVAAADTNERFGGISYKRMGRSAGTMDASRLLALAPDWLESEMRFMARTFGDEGKLARRDVAKMALYMWGAARVLNYLTTGQPHNEAPFGIVHRDEEGRDKVYSLRTMPTDMLHAVSDPGGFLKGRVSPLMRVAAQTYTGRDEFGRKIADHGVFVNLLRNIAPIPAQSAVKYATGENPEISVSDSLVKGLGATVYPYRTEAQKAAAQIASEKSEAGPVDPNKLRRHQTVLEIENRVRQGKIPVQDIYGMVEKGSLHVDEAKTILKNAQETQGMDNGMARLYMHVARLPMADAIEVWNKATNDEKAVLAKILLKKKQAYLKKAYKDMSPEERESDKAYQWIRKNFPNEAPWGGGGGSGAGNSAERFLGPARKPQKGDEQYNKGNDLVDEFIPGSVDKPEMKPISPELEASLPPFLRKIGARLGFGPRGDEKAVADVGRVIDKDKQDITVRMPELFTRAMLAHEMTHVYQHTRKDYSRPEMADPYKPGAYDYGGLDGLKDAAAKGKTIADFSNEKQAKIIEDYYRLHVNAISLAKKQGGFLTPKQAEQYETIRNVVSRLAGQLAGQPSENEPESDQLTLPSTAPGRPSYKASGEVELDPVMVGVMQPIPVHEKKKK